MGLYLRGKIWWVSFTIDGKAHKKSTGTRNRKMAEKVWAKIQTRIVESQWFDIDNARQYSYEDLMNRFMEKYAPKKEVATQDMYRYARKHLDTRFGGKRLSEITDVMISDYMDDRFKKGAKPATINREFSTLSKAFTEAYKKWKWIRSNPCTLVSKFEEKNIKNVWLTIKQEKKLIECAEKYLNGDLPDMIILAIHTGMRRGEILNLEISHINLSEKLVTALETKNKEPRTIPLNRTVHAMLKRRLSTKDKGYLFSTTNGTKYAGKNVLRAFKSALARVEKEGVDIGRFWFHGLRHTFGTRLAQAGKNSRQIGELMGIHSATVLRRYTHFSVGSLRGVVQSLDEDYYGEDIELDGNKE